jgi:two-component system NtrC family sensor kinase
MPTTPLTATTDARWVASGLRTRVLVPLGLGLVLLITSLVVLIAVARMKRGAEDIAETAKAVNVILEERTAHEVQVMRSLMEMVERDPRLQAAFRSRDRQALLALSAPIMDSIRARNAITNFSYVLSDRTALLRVHAPERHGDRLDRFLLQEAQRTGKPLWGNEQGQGGTLTLRVVHPWRVGGELIGYLEMGIEFEHLVGGIKESLGADVFVAIDKSRLDTGRGRPVQGMSYPAAWDEFPEVVVLSRTTPVIPPPVRAYLAQPLARHDKQNFEAQWDGRVAQAILTPLSDLRGQQVGELVVLQDISGAAQERRRAIVTVVLLGSAVGGALMLFFHALLGRVQQDVSARTARLDEARRVLAQEQHERQRAEHELNVQQERNELLEARGRMVEELAEATRTAEAALRKNEEITGKLRETQSALLATAREAGRAEIATNVLHNVGNVLNSVNVSAGVIRAALAQSRLPRLPRAIGLMDEHAADLGGFLAHSEKGRQLPAYLKALAQALSREQQVVQAELERLTKSIEHIKEIVNTQQSHAKGGSVIEPVRASELAEDALRLQGSALERHQVTVIREFEPVPVVALDRGRVLQILVNLISNAKSAMSALADGALTLRVELADATRLRFSVRDEGEGIPAENLTRIFAHGFTTRKTGHGFGLHSSALAAAQMGGTLTARSDGPGKGATFTLELPIDAGQAA